MSNMGRAIIYQDENNKKFFNLDDVIKRVTTLTVEQVAAMTYNELAAIFPKYESGEFRPLQHGKIWGKLAELERNLPQDCREYREKMKILSGIRYDGMNV